MNALVADVTNVFCKQWCSSKVTYSFATTQVVALLNQE